MRTRRICVSLKENAGCARFAVAACPLVAPLCRPSLRPGAACFQGVLRPRREALGSEGLCCWTDPVAMEQRDRERPEVGLRKLNNAQLPESATTLSNSIRRVLDECRGRDWFQGCTVSVNSRAATVTAGALHLRLMDARQGRVRAEMTTGLGEGWRGCRLDPRPRLAADLIGEMFQDRQGPHLWLRNEPLPGFSPGDGVRITGKKADRVQVGIVRRLVWHHKIGRWMYLLENEAGPINLRFWQEELEPA